MLDFIAKIQLPESLVGTIDTTLESMKYRLVHIRVLTEHKGTVLQIMAEPSSGEPMTIQDCVTLTRLLSPLMDVHDTMSGAYNLEVSSPGVDRPLARRSDFERFQGETVKVTLYEAYENRRSFKGTLLGLDLDQVKLVWEGQEIGFSLADVKESCILWSPPEAGKKKSNKGNKRQRGQKG